jgi:ABC-2 type transport system permease protein
MGPRVTEQAFRAALRIQALALNQVLFAAATCAFLALLASARRNGSLLQTGE